MFPPRMENTMMDIIFSSKKDEDEPLKINGCRMTFKVHYLQDILLIDGKSILPQAYIRRFIGAENGIDQPNPHFLPVVIHGEFS